MIELEWGYKIVVMGLLVWMGKTIWYDQKRSVDSKQSEKACTEMRGTCKELIATKIENLSDKIDELRNGQSKVFERLDRIINGK